MPQQERQASATSAQGRTHAGPSGLGSRLALAGLRFALAVQFLTVLPLPARWLRHLDAAHPADTADAADGAAFSMTPSLAWFPVVGALLGVLVALLDRLLAFALSGGERAVADLAALALVTGLLHLDGFIDCCDALPGARTVERRLDILRDSRVGAYGVVGGALLLLGQYAALAPLPGTARVLALVAAPLLGRCAMVYAVARYPYARSAGAGSGFRGAGAGALRAAVLVGVLLLVALCLALFWRVPLGALALAGCLALVAGAVALGWTHWASARLGGQLTGDTYGALNELVTLAVFVATPPLLALCLRLG